MAVTVSVGPLAFVLPFSPENLLDSVLERKSERGAIFLSKTETRVAVFQHGAKRPSAQEPRLSGVEDLNGGNRRVASGGICLSRRRYSCARAAPWDETTSAAGGPSSEGLRDEHQRWVFVMGAEASESRVLGVPPLERTRPEEEEWF